jgi:hypothetical protein
LDVSSFPQYWTVKGSVLSFDSGRLDPISEGRLFVDKLFHEVLTGMKTPPGPLHTYEIISVTDDTLHLKYTGTRMFPPPEYELKRVGP